MGRIERWDEAGAWQHFGNRALGHRAMFETSEDVSSFHRELTRAADAGRIQLPCLATLTTHFHGVARFPRGGMSSVLRDIESAYVRDFNLRRDRDGPLVLGPFFSVRLFTDEDVLRSVRYVDFNAVLAGMAAHPFAYENGSAFHYAHGSCPPWMRREWVERTVCELAGTSKFSAADYERQILGPMSDDERRTILETYERLARAGGRALGPAEGIRGSVRDWIRERCSIADGTAPGVFVASSVTVVEAVERWRQRGPSPWVIGRGTAARDGWATVLVALLRFASAQHLDQIAVMTGVGTSSVRRALVAHRFLRVWSREYADVFDLVLTDVLARVRRI